MVDVLLFSVAAAAAGSDRIAVPVTLPTTVRSLRGALAEACPALANLLPTCRIAVALAFSADDDVISPGSELAVIPPVSGG